MRHILNFILLFTLIQMVAHAQPGSTRNQNIDTIVSGGALVLSPTGNVDLDAPLVFHDQTEAQRDALTPIGGMVVWNTESGQLNVYDGSDWGPLAGGGGEGGISFVTPSGVFYGEASATGGTDEANFAYDVDSKTLSVTGGYFSSNFNSDRILYSSGDKIEELTPVSEFVWYNSELDEMSITGTAGEISVDLITSTGKATYKVGFIAATAPISAGVCIYKDIKATGVSCGNSVDDSYTARDLTTEVTASGCSDFASLSSNQITISVDGTYFVEFRSALLSVGTTHDRFVDVNDSNNRIMGVNGFSITNADAGNGGSGIITASGTYEYQYYVNQGGGGGTLGQVLNLAGDEETCAEVQIWKLD